MMNDVQDKQRRQRRNTASAGTDKRFKAGHAVGAKQAKNSASGIEKTGKKAEILTAESFGKVWNKVRRTMNNAPKSIQEDAQGVKFSVHSPDFNLYVTRDLKDYIEENMDVFKPILWPLIRRCGCNRLVYVFI